MRKTKKQIKEEKMIKLSYILVGICMLILIGCVLYVFHSFSLLKAHLNGVQIGSEMNMSMCEKIDGIPDEGYCNIGGGGEHIWFIKCPWINLKTYTNQTNLFLYDKLILWLLSCDAVGRGYKPNFDYNFSVIQ